MPFLCTYTRTLKNVFPVIAQFRLIWINIYSRRYRGYFGLFRGREKEWIVTFVFALFK